jgi:catechol 2,3-dioxygenase-like lactoylglutathione lyase family enzyme
VLPLPGPPDGNRPYGVRVIRGAHVILYSADADSDRAFLRDVLGLASVDSGGGWLIFRLPPSEVAVHPAEASGAAELYLICDDVDETVAELERRGVVFEGPVSDEGWGRLATVRLPGGGRLGVYEARHATALDL